MGDYSFLVFNGEPTLDGVVAGLKVGDKPMALVTVRDCGDLMKAEGAIPSGSRWITVHPNGNDAKGVPVLVQEQKKGSGIWHVIGGAGGKLNYLKIRGVKSEAEYKQGAAEQQKAKREAAKDQKSRDKELGLDKAKKAARENISTQRVAAERGFIKAVGEAMGWDQSEMQFDEAAHAELSDAAKDKAKAKHHRELLKRAGEVVDLQRRRLVADEDARRSADLGEIPLETTDDSQLSVDDLMPVKVPDGAGFAAGFKERAEKNGLTDDELRRELDGMREEETGSMDDAKRRAAIKRGETAQMVREELEKVKVDKPDLKAKLTDAKKAVELLKAEKQLKAFQKQAREAGKAVDTSVVEPKAYVLQAEEATDADVAKEVDDELRSARTRAFLSEIGKVDPSGESLGNHIAAGAFNSINSLSLAAGGASMLDRSAVDVLGVAGAAQVLARKLRTSLGKDADRLAEGLEEFHTQHYMKLSQESLREAHELQEAAKELELGEAENAGDLLAAASINRQRREALAAASKTLGQALGEMEANAALVMALKERGRDSMQVSLGRTRPEEAIRQVRALGLQHGDYKIEQAGGNTFLTLNGAGMDRIAGDADPENAARVRRNLDIMQGKFDQDDWLPDGFARRPDLCLNLKPGVAASLAQPMDFSNPDIDVALKDYIGGRMADGDRPADILADIQSADFFNKTYNTDDYRKALDAVAPNKSDEKSLARVERLEGVFQDYADDFVARKYGPGVSSLNKQNIPVDEKTQDALHRALCDEPSGVAAFKPIGEMTPQDQKALRDFFYKNVAHESEEGAALRADYDRLGENEPEKSSLDMFGEESENPDWRAWKAERDGLAEKLNDSSLNWPKYAAMMRGHENAYAAVQDLIRSRVSESFAKHYNTLNPDKPVKLGRSLVRGNLNHLDAVDPAAREKRLAQERELVDSLREREGGRYASGRVADKLDSARDAKEAAAQAQMGFFASDDMFGGGDMFGHEAPAEKPLGADERHTIGHAAERTLAGMVGVVGKNFKANQPVKLFQPTMSGKDGVARQRAIKMIQANERVGLGFGVGSGKAQPLDAKILTPTGWVRMGDIQVGDKVIAGDGSVTTVTGVFPQGEKEIFRVTMADGGSTECCDEHLWFTTTEVERKRIAYSKRGHKPTRDRLPDFGVVRSLSEIRTSLVVRHGIRNHHIPVAGLPNFEYSEVPVEPYLLGSLLGDGDMSASNVIKFTSADMESVVAVSSLLPDDLVLRQGAGNQGITYGISKGFRGGLNAGNKLVLSLRELGLMERHSHTKFVPKRYLFNSCDVRLAVLQGLMDTDGTVGKDGIHVTFTTVSESLADDVEFLVRSLGGLSRRTSRTPTYTHKGEKRNGRIAFTITLTLPDEIEPFRLSRKSVKVRHKTKYAPRCRVISSVEPVGKKLAQCIAVDHPSHLYVTDDFIVTHNTAIGLGAFSHLHGAGTVKKGVFIVPSIVQGQFGAEALRFLEPGKFNWHCEPGGDREGRLKAYRDGDTHFVVATHQSFRDDMLHMAAGQEGGTPEQIASKLEGMDKKTRSAYIKGVLEKEGINFDYVMADEAHGLLNREGKENSRMSNVVEGVTDNARYYVHASGDPVKNDASEIFDLLSKMDGNRYKDRAAFMRKYGGDTSAAKEGLRREMARHLYSASINPDIKVDSRDVRVPLSDGQRAALSEVSKHVAAARVAKMEGRVDVGAMRALVPQAFEGAKDADHEAIARGLSDSIGIVKTTAVRRVLDNHPTGGKMDAVSKMAADRKGKPGVVFAHSLDAVESLRKRLEAEGHRVVTITGKDSAKDKAAKIQAFNPDKGERTADIVVASDAGATGANLQSGQWLTQFDTPMTAMTHAQRRGRINRIGQKNNIELMDLVSEHPDEDKARKRLTEKYGLRELVTSPLDGLDDTGVAGFLRQRQAEQDQGGLF